VLDQLAPLLFTVGVPRTPGTNSDLRLQVQELLQSPARLRASWTAVMRRLQDDGYEAGEFALVCRVHLNLLDNCAALLEILNQLSDDLGLAPEELRSAATDVKAQQDDIRPLAALATRKAPPLDVEQLAEAGRKHAGQPAIEVGEFLRQLQSGEAEW